MLQLRDISYAAGGKEILKHIDLDIHERFVAITGPNGSGKSTLAKLIMGIEHPTGGNILLDGEDITDWYNTASALPFNSRFASRGSPCVI